MSNANFWRHSKRHPKLVELISRPLQENVAISFHLVREAVVAGIIAPYWLKGKFNISDIMTIQISGPEFKIYCNHIFCLPKFHVYTDNQLDALFV